MYSQSSGPIATFLMLVPLVAVPLLAVFGIPQFAPVSASILSDIDDIAKDDITDATSTPPSQSPSQTPDATNEPQNHLHSHQPIADRPTPKTMLVDIDKVFDRQNSGLVRPVASHTDFQKAKPIVHPRNEKPARFGKLTWQSAVHRLNELGIQRYQLDSGQQKDSFHFMCSYTPRDNPRVTHRFEAEATSPLIAVERVLSQISQWKQQRPKHGE